MQQRLRVRDVQQALHVVVVELGVPQRLQIRQHPVHRLAARQQRTAQRLDPKLPLSGRLVRYLARFLVGRHGILLPVEMPEHVPPKLQRVTAESWIVARRPCGQIELNERVVVVVGRQRLARGVERGLRGAFRVACLEPVVPGDAGRRWLNPFEPFGDPGMQPHALLCAHRARMHHGDLAVGEAIAQGSGVIDRGEDPGQLRLVQRSVHCGVVELRQIGHQPGRELAAHHRGDRKHVACARGEMC